MVVRETFGWFSPEQVQASLDQLLQDLNDRQESHIGIKVGDRFVRRDEFNGAEEVWVLRQRIINVLDRFVPDDPEHAFHVGLVRPVREHMNAEDLDPIQVWSGWMPVGDVRNLTDQEWRRVRDGIEFWPEGTSAPDRKQTSPPPSAAY